MTPPTNSRPLRRQPPESQVDGRKDGKNIQLMRAMGSKRGYDPIPPSQYEWQRADGEPPLLRMWSWFCAHTIAHGRMSPYAVREDGTAATLKDCAKDLALDLGQVSNLFVWGAEKGLWRRKNGRELYFSGDVTAAQVREANTRRKVECALNLSPAESLIIKGWPEEVRNRFNAVWSAAQNHHREELATLLAERRKQHTRIDATIRSLFPLPKKRGVKVEQMQLFDLPVVILRMLDNVHSTSVQSTPVECTDGEEKGENVSVPPAPSLLLSEKSQNGVIPSASAVLDQEADHLVAALQIDADAAFKLLTDSRKVEPSLTWREVLALSHKKLHDVKPRHSVAGLLLATVPGMAKGSMLSAAREAVVANLIHLVQSGRFPTPALTVPELNTVVCRLYPGESIARKAELLGELIEAQHRQPSE